MAGTKIRDVLYINLDWFEWFACAFDFDAVRADFAFYTHLLEDREDGFVALHRLVIKVADCDFRVGDGCGCKQECG